MIGGVLIPGAAAPKLVTADLIRRMKAGSVVVDVAIDQGGCIETSRPTTHSEPTFIVDDVIHYCVANIPGAVPRTSTFALNNATLPHVLALADKGYRQALTDDRHLRNGLNVCAGAVTCKAVSDALGLAYRDPMKAMAGTTAPRGSELSWGSGARASSRDDSVAPGDGPPSPRSQCRRRAPEGVHGRGKYQISVRQANWQQGRGCKSPGTKE